VAPGWELTGSLHFAEADNINGSAVAVNNDATALIINNTFKF